jgi:hypothetical protein
MPGFRPVVTERRPVPVLCPGPILRVIEVEIGTGTSANHRDADFGLLVTLSTEFLAIRHGKKDFSDFVSCRPSMPVGNGGCSTRSWITIRRKSTACIFSLDLNDLIRAHGQHVRGITTDASPLYLLPVALALDDVPHQVCEFPILKELTKAVLRVLARLRKRLGAEIRKLPTDVRRRMPRRAGSISVPKPSGSV